VEIGVDDGQFARILNFEIPQLKRAFKGKLFLENKEKTFFIYYFRGLSE
jgi:hypothetical protein